MPSGTSDDFVGSGLRPKRVLRRALAIVFRIIPVGDPLPDVAGDIIEPVGAFSRFIAADRHQGFDADPRLTIVEVRIGRFHIAPGEAPLIVSPRRKSVEAVEAN